MSWFVFALAGTAIFGLVALTDKYMLTTHFTDALVYAWVTGVAGGGSALVATAVLAATGDFHPPGVEASTWLLAPGALLFLAGFTYMRAMSGGVATVVVAYSQLTPVFAFGLGFWVLSEHLSTLQVAGMVLVIGSAIGLTLGGVSPPGPDGYVSRRTWWAIGAALPLMLLSCVFRASSDLLMKQQTVDAGVLTAYLVSRQGVLLCAVLLLLNRRLRSRIWVGLRATTKRSWVALSLVEVGAVSSFFLLAVALNRGPLALVSVISSNVAVFTLIYAAVFGGLLKVPNVPPIGIAWQRLVACLGFMAVGTLALSSWF